VSGGGLARLLFKTGLSGYDRPVFKWTPRKYEVHEFDKLESVERKQVNWYGLAGSIVGFTYPPEEDAWGAEVIERDRIEAKREAVTDGGTKERSNLPGNYVRAPEWVRADVYAAFVPKTLKRNCYYLDSGIARRRFADSAVGKKALQQLTESKKKHGEDMGLSDNQVLYGMIGLGAMSFLAGIWVFFL
jgi:hypothetical protein